MVSDENNSLSFGNDVQAVAVLALRDDLVLGHVDLRLQFFRQKLDQRLVEVEDRVAPERRGEDVLNDFFAQRRRDDFEKRFEFVLRVEQALGVRQVAGYFGLQFLGQVEVFHCRRGAVELFLKVGCSSV